MVEGCIPGTDRRWLTGAAGVLDRGALSKGLARNLGELPSSFLPLIGDGTSRTRRARPEERQGCADLWSEEASRGRGTGRRRKEAPGMGRERSYAPHGTDEGGEPARLGPTGGTGGTSRRIGEREHGGTGDRAPCPRNFAEYLNGPRPIRCGDSPRSLSILRRKRWIARSGDYGERPAPEWTA